jgi:ABC-type branched-subunit amino acid transport system substrate-binding protein
VSSRDRWLAGLFAFQLVVAAVLGIVLVNALDDPVRPSVVTAVPGPIGSTAPQATAIATTSAKPGTTTTTTTTTTGGSKGSTVTTPTGSKQVLAAGAPIKIGTIVTQTGAINFVSSAQATKAYFDLLNRRGGINGHKIVLDLRDDKLDSARGRQQAQELVDEGVFAFTGWRAPLTENGITDFLAKNKIPLIGAYGEQEEYHSPYSYLLSASYGHFGFQMSTYLAEQGVKKPGLVYITNNSQSADAGLVKAFKDGFKSKGITLADADIISVDPTKPSYDDVVTQFQLDGVDGMATLLDQTAYNRLTQSQERQAYRPKHAASPLFVDPSVTQSATTEGTFVATDYDFVQGGGSVVQDYANAVKAAYGAKAQVNYFGEQGWADALAFTQAVQSLGANITRDGLLKAMDGLQGKGGFGFTSDLHFGPGVRDLNRCVKFGKIVSGKVTRVTDWRCDEQPF